jgi:hypothetical protein
MVAFKSLAGEVSRLKPIFEQDEINLKIIMNFLLLAKLMNKVLLTSPLLNSYSPSVNFRIYLNVQMNSLVSKFLIL